VAPLFYLAVGGLPLAMTYKAVNTLDSMVGYKNEKYHHLGWAAARLDDLANYFPARITGFMIVLSVFLVSLVQSGVRSLSAARHSVIIMNRDGRKHPSPNSGIPEAAMAGALRIQLGGPSTYAGVLSNKPFIGDGERDDYLAASNDAVRIVMLSSTIAALLTIAISALRMQ
jgi:adenosylcobinamide-phosphate synthase